jgi:hypothetical protein
VLWQVVIAESDEDLDRLTAEKHSGLISQQFRFYFNHFRSEKDYLRFFGDTD